MSYHPGRGLSFVSKDHTGRRRFVVPCAHCDSVATVTTPGGVRLCELHSRTSSWSNTAVAALLFAAVGTSLGLFGVAYLHDDGSQMLIAAGVGIACTWGAAVAWNEARR